MTPWVVLMGGVALAVLWFGSRTLGRNAARLRRSGRGRSFGLVLACLALLMIARGHLETGLALALLAALNLAGGRWAGKAKFNGWSAARGPTDKVDFDPRGAAFDEAAAAARHSQGMSEHEAYQLLGLGEGASHAEVGEAYRRLMKTAHPDRGGSAQWAARLNEAKQVLTRRHR
jgi:DnaJ-domain-containing protein 1